MKKSKKLIIAGLMSCFYLQTFSQSTISGGGGHAAGAGPAALFWCGWNAATTIPLNIQHRGTDNINFFTGGNAPAFQRMTILGTAAANPGFIGMANGPFTPLFRLDVNDNINMNKTALINQGYRINGQLVVQTLQGGTTCFLGQTNKILNAGVNSTYAGFNSGVNSVAPNTCGFGVNTGIQDVGAGGSYFGWQAGMLNTTGDFNTWVGGQSGENNTTGNNNVGLGAFTGLGLTSGDLNMFIGVGANTPVNNVTNSGAIGPFTSVIANNQIILGNMSQNVGIGLSGINPGPQNKLEIRRVAAINPVSGLRLRDLAGAVPLAANGQVLSVNAAGDVILTQSPIGAFGGICGSTPPALTSNWEIPMATFNYVYTGQGINTTNVGIGTGCVPNAKLQVQQTSGSVLGSIGINVDNDDLTPCFSNDYVIGLKATTNLLNAGSTISGLYRIAGWFESSTANGCGLVNNYAIHVPKNGGVVTIGYATPFSGGALVDIDGVTNSSGGYTSSDASLKNTVVTLPNSLNKIKSLRPVTFKWNTPNDSLMNGTHAGFIAQEVDTVIPQVVRTNGNGIKSVAYSELIPYLVSAIQAQQKQIKQMDSLITALTQSVSSCCSNSAARQTGINGNDPSALTQININLSDVDMVILNQNTPNPFAEQTTITYNVPEKYGFAQLVFKTIDGKIIKTVDITKKGRGQVNVFANDLSNGLYMYSLIVDGTTVDTKKMVKQN